jgi:hypothetical protein
MNRRSVTIPDPMYSLEQYDQFHHLDIEYLSDSELRMELHRRRGVIWERPELKSTWLQERVDRLEAELIRRHKTVSQRAGVFSKYPDNRPVPAEGIQI